MGYLSDGFRLSLTVTPMLFFLLMSVGGLAHGRLKIEPHSPWIVRRDQPFKFAAVVASYLIAGIAFAAMSILIASRLLN